MEAGQAYRNDVEKVNDVVVSVISRETRIVMKSDLPEQIARQVYRNKASNRDIVTAYLSNLSEALDRPLLLFIDEIDSLVGDSLVSILRQIRAGYGNRPQHFPQSIILCGVRDVRDILIDKLREDRVRRVIGPILSGEDGEKLLKDDDIQYVVDMGLIVRDKPLCS